MKSLIAKARAWLLKELSDETDEKFEPDEEQVADWAGQLEEVWNEAVEHCARRLERLGEKGGAAYLRFTSDDPIQLTEAEEAYGREVAERLSRGSNWVVAVGGGGGGGGAAKKDDSCDHGFAHWGQCPLCNHAGMACTPRVEMPTPPTLDTTEERLRVALRTIEKMTWDSSISGRMIAAVALQALALPLSEAMAILASDKFPGCDKPECIAAHSELALQDIEKAKLADCPICKGGGMILNGPYGEGEMMSLTGDKCNLCGGSGKIKP